MKFIRPTLITDAALIASNAPENDHPEWNAVTAYALGNRCIRTTTHRIYERLVVGTTVTAPELDAVNWLDIGPTNRWAMFDRTTGSATSLAAPLVITIAPGAVSHLALLALQASSVRVQMTDGPAGPSVYDRTFVMVDVVPVVDWWGYYFGPLELQSELIIDDLPPYLNSRVTVTINHGTTAKCGTLAIGVAVEVGGTRYGVGIGITDYSRKSTDEFGVTSVVQRGFAKRIDVPVWCANNRLDYIASQLSAVRAVPCVWVASSGYGVMIVYGFYKDWSIDIQYPNHCEARLTIEELI